MTDRKQNKKPGKNPILKGKLIKDILPNWPDLQWACSEADPDAIRIDPQKAIIKKVIRVGAYLRITIEENSRPWNGNIYFTQAKVRRRVFDVLLKRIGRTLEQVGNVKL
jgi:hypothetical protein